MLTAIRTAASNWLGRVVLIVIMSLLIISFAIWGIGDVFRGSTSVHVASVGKVNIGAEQFRTTFNEELQRIQSRTRRVITMDEARAFGLDRALLNRMIDEAALNVKATSLGLALDQTAVARSVLDADAFKVAGVFDRNRFADILQRSGLTEAAFLRQQGEAMLRQQLLVGLAGALKAPDILDLAEHQHRNEERNLDVVAVPLDKVAEPAVPDDAALRAFHAERKGEFRTAEFRSATVLATSSTLFAEGITFSDEDLRSFYDRAVKAGTLGSPEKRRALRILFDTEAEAKAAADKLAAGTDIAVLLAERKPTEKDVDLGMKASGELADAAVRDAVFTLKVGETSAPIKDAFGSVLIRLVGIEPASAPAFDTVRTQLESVARADKISRDPGVRLKLDAAFRAVEDQRIAGKSLAEAAAAAKLVPVVIPALDRQGRDGSGSRLSIPGDAATIAALFASDIGLDNEPLQQGDGGHVWIEVNGVEPARERLFDEVKDEVRVRLVAEQRGKALAELTTGLVKKIEEGATLASVAGELGLSVQKFNGIKRSTRDPSLGQNGVERAFSAGIGKPVSAIAADGEGRLLIVPLEASLLPFDPAEAAKSGATARTAQAMAEDIVTQLTAGVRKEIGVSINTQALNRSLGQTN